MIDREPLRDNNKDIQPDLSRLDLDADNTAQSPQQRREWNIDIPKDAPEQPPRFVSNELGRYEHLGEWYDLTEKIIKGLLNGSLSTSDGEQIIKDTPSIREAYPSLEIPPSFLAERPDILFVPLSIRRFKPQPIITRDGEKSESPYGDLYDILKDTELPEKPLLNLEDVTSAWETAISLLHKPTIDPLHAEEILSQLTFGSYLGNLELHRLTADKEGTVIRYTRNEQEILPPEELSEYGPYAHSLPDRTLNLAKGKHITYWFRKDGRGLKNWFPGRRPVITTIGELEKSHYLALDTAEDCAVVALSKATNSRIPIE